MVKAVFLKMVQEELDSLRKNVTKEELNDLDFKSLDVEQEDCCIYGQMTGRCDSERAKELYPKVFYGINKEAVDYWRVVRYFPFSKHSFIEGNNYTALEKYLFMVKEPQHKKVINYLKGELSEIKL